MTTRLPLVVALALVALAAGCRGDSATSSTTATLPTPTTGTSIDTTPTLPSTTATTPTTAAPAAPTTTTPPAPATASSGCHVTGSGEYVLPDPNCTPGATNPDVTPANIAETICRSGWTATVRPPESYTEPVKVKDIAAYGDYAGSSAIAYELDHLIPLELGGAPSDPSNLWPEAGEHNVKDSVENAANKAVCSGRMSLATAQQAMASNWISLGHQLGVS